MLAAVVLLAAIATAAVGAAPTEECEMENVNLMTEMMITYQKFEGETMKERNFEEATLSLSSGEAVARDLTLRGVDSLYRSGDCFQCDTSESHKLDLQLGWKSLELSVGELRLEKGGVPFAATFRLRGVTIKVSLDDIGNEPVVKRLEVLSLGDKVEMSAPNTDYDGKDVTGLAKEFVLPYVNNRLEQLRQELNEKFHRKDSQVLFQEILKLLS